MKQMITKDSACLKDTRGKSLETSGDPQVSKRRKIKPKNSLEKASLLGTGKADHSHQRETPNQKLSWRSC